jgi:UDP-glucose 4-epimerase
MEKVLITGISGGQGRILARRLMGTFEVCGVDRVGWEKSPEGIRVHVVDLTRKKFEDVIRTEAPDHVVHMGFIRHFRTDERTRYDVNVRGTRRLLDHCVQHGVKSVAVLSSSYVYGAFPENPYCMDEDAPLSASRSYPEIRDMVEVDALSTAFLWRYPEIRTTVLRPVNVLGYYVHSMVGHYLRERRVPTVMGFDPMMQFIHEEDLADAIACTVEQELRGVFNVTGPGEVPLHTAIHEAGGTAIPVPEILLRPLLARLFDFGVLPYPPGTLDFLKYPITVSGDAFVEASGFRPAISLGQTLQSTRD